MSIERTNYFTGLVFPSIAIISCLNIINLKVKQSRDTRSMAYTINVFFLILSILLFVGIYSRILRNYSLWRNNFGYIIVGVTLTFFIFTIYNIYNDIISFYDKMEKDVFLLCMTILFSVCFCIWIIRNKYNKEKIDVFNDLVVATDLKKSILKVEEKKDKKENEEDLPEKIE